MKNLMTIAGIGKPEGDRLYRDCPGSEYGIFYYEDLKSNLLFREILKSDSELVKKILTSAAKRTYVEVVDTRTGQHLFRPVKDFVMKAKSSNKDELNLLVFNIKTKEPICIIDAKTVPNTDFESCTAACFFNSNTLTKRYFQNIIKQRFEAICIDSGLFKEVLYTGFY